MRSNIIWSIKDIVEILKARQENEFDGNVVISGNRGDGKSNLINKICYRFVNFNPWKHQVYSREDVIRLLKKEYKGLCWDDEAVNSGYKRDFQSKAQQLLIKIVTMYRDNFNIYASAIPNFFSLDKDLRDLMFLHIHVIERGIAIIHMPLQGRLYSQDRWDTKNNANIEQRWINRSKKDPSFKPPYHTLSTFKGYLFFGDFSKKQKELYLLVKKTRRNELYGEEESNVKERESFLNRIYKLIIDKKITKEGLFQICLHEEKKYSTITTSLNRMLTDNGVVETLAHFLQHPNIKVIHNKTILDNLEKIG